MKLSDYGYTIKDKDEDFLYKNAISDTEHEAWVKLSSWRGTPCFDYLKANKLQRENERSILKSAGWRIVKVSVKEL